MKPAVFKILKESVSLYFRNIFRFIEIVAWVTLPASIFFVLIFYWGLPEQALYALTSLSYPASFVLLFLLNAVVTKSIQAMDEGKPLSTLRVYTVAFNLFGSYLGVLALVSLRILLWSLPFILSSFIFFWIGQSGGPVWLPGLSLIFLAPIFIAACHYSFSFPAFLVDGIKWKDAPAESKRIIKWNFWKFLGNMLVLFFITAPFYGQIFRWKETIVTTPLAAENLFPLLLSNCVINFLAATISVFPVVFFYFLYKEFRGKNGSLRGNTGLMK
ncbi:MAG TPA: hypothetical protein VJA17_05290 [Candidatus Omnitrophota bacterium]|nr:hypothetical protein [Candidatus Omnitrophota bacterium]